MSHILSRLPLLRVNTVLPPNNSLQARDGPDGPRPGPRTLCVTTPMRVSIVEAGLDDLDAALRVERAAFGQEDEAELVAALLEDPSAEPHLSLLALVDNKPLGHVLFTAVTIGGAETSCPAAILAPLAVHPEVQRRGVGKALIEDGARRLAAAGVRLLFVLGHPAYYTTSGFVPAMPLGLLPRTPSSHRRHGWCAHWTRTQSAQSPA